MKIYVSLIWIALILCTSCVFCQSNQSVDYIVEKLKQWGFSYSDTISQARQNSKTKELYRIKQELSAIKKLAKENVMKVIIENCIDKINPMSIDSVLFEPTYVIDTAKLSSYNDSMSLYSILRFKCDTNTLCGFYTIYFNRDSMCSIYIEDNETSGKAYMNYKEFSISLNSTQDFTCYDNSLYVEYDSERFSYNKCYNTEFNNYLNYSKLIVAQDIIFCYVDFVLLQRKDLKNILLRSYYWPYDFDNLSRCIDNSSKK